MKTRSLALLGCIAFARVLFGASTGTSALHMPQGSAAGTANGDYVSDSTALNTFYRYFIEVPPGIGQMVVEVFDMDIGAGGVNEDDAGRDRDRGGGFTTTTSYTLLRPDGTTAAGPINCSSAVSATCPDNAWGTILNSTAATNRVAGHWELRVDTNGGNDINAIGIRAHDGTSGSGGTELNVYADSMVSLGINPNPNAATRAYTMYPWITSGCSCLQNDFDRDTNNGDTGSVTYTSRGGTFTQTFTSATLSTDNTWNRDTVSGWVDDDNVEDYGIWTWAPTISTYTVGGVNGNYETAYVANSQAAANPPTANPITNAFRIYLPNDAGTAPVKPYLEQLLTYRIGFGTNPPTVGNRTTYTVTVRLVNPTPFAITFSAANLVTANVPGGQVLYGGNANVAQGSITAQPAVGGSGNVTWNPGTVAAGATIIMSYDVRVTPTGGARISVTGTPASGNGTRATFVDETGNTTQTRATYSTGGLCDLGVQANVTVTEALVSSFHLDVRGGATSIEWATASEAGTVGFNVYREDGSRVNDTLVPASLKAYGGKYKIIDRNNADPNARYVIEEVTASATRRRHGPFHHLEGIDREALQRASNKPRLRVMSNQQIASDAAKDKVVAAMAGVSENGIVRISAASLAATLGDNASSVRAKLNNGSVTVTSNGSPVAWTTDGDNLLFYGQKSTSLYANERVYRIELAKGTTMKMLSLAPSNAAVSTFTATQDRETDVFPATVLPLDAESDYWFWDFVISGDPTDGRKTFHVNIPSVASSSGATLAVRLQGAFADGAHKALVSLNGVPVGEANWSSLDANTTTLNIPAAALQDGDNEIAVEGVLAGGEGIDIFYVDGFAVTYQKLAHPENGAIEVRGSGAIGAGPFTSAPVILDITNPLRPQVVQGAAFNGGNAQLTLPSAKTLIFAESFVTPSSLRGAAAWKYDNARADWVAIAPRNMMSAAESLASLRRREGLSTLVVDLEQIYDEFAGGNSTPHAIRQFIRSTRTWDRAPRYFVLAGIGNIDYRGIEIPPGPVPPLMTTTKDGIFASDSLFADFNGDKLPDVAIGRIPVSTASELSAYVAKLLNNAAIDASNSPIVFSADTQDGETSFRSASVSAETPLAARPASRVYLDDLGPGNARERFFAAWQNGTPLVSWVGHGGLDQLSNSAVLTAYDASSLTSSGRLPILVAMTCTINRFETGLVDALGTAFTREDGAGAVAVWSASGLSLHPQAANIQQTFMRLAESSPAGTRIGDLIVPSLAAFKNETSSIYLLLGDPAIRLDLPREVTNGGPSAPGE